MKRDNFFDIWANAQEELRRLFEMEHDSFRILLKGQTVVLLKPRAIQLEQDVGMFLQNIDDIKAIICQHIRELKRIIDDEKVRGARKKDVEFIEGRANDVELRIRNMAELANLLERLQEMLCLPHLLSRQTFDLIEKIYRSVREGMPVGPVKVRYTTTIEFVI